MKKLLFSVFFVLLMIPGATALAAGSGQYVNYNCTLYSGVNASISSGTNYSYRAGIYAAYSDTFNISAWTYEFRNGKTTSPKSLNSGGSCTYDSVVYSPGSSVKAVLCKYNINTAKHVSGNFYYNGF